MLFDVSLDSILLSFENTLRIEYVENDTNRLLKESIKRIESAIGVKIDSDLYDLQAKNALVSDSINVFINQLAECGKNMALFVDISMFNRSILINLRDVNYLGFADRELLTALKYLQDAELYQRNTEIIEPISRALISIEMCTVKRLFLIMLVLDKLGVRELVSLIARLLYLGGIK